MAILVNQGLSNENKMKNRATETTIYLKISLWVGISINEKDARKIRIYMISIVNIGFMESAYG